MSTESETQKSFDPFETWRAARDASLESLRSMRDASLESWSKLMIDFVNSDAYSQATAQWLDTYLTVSQPFQRTFETTMTQTLTGLNMPTRDDVTNLAGRLTNIEMRLDDLDIKLDDIQHAVQALSSSKDDVQHDLDAKLDDIHRAVQTLSSSKDDVQRAVQTLSSFKDDIQHAIQTFSVSRDATVTSATASRSPANDASASPVKQSDETQEAASAHPTNDAGISTAKRSVGKQGKAKETH